jgi:hypothetical protein
MATIQPLTTIQIKSMDLPALEAYTAQLSAAISTAMDTSGYTYETLTPTELDLLSPSELYTYSINLSTLRATELYNKSLLDTVANIAVYQTEVSQSTLQGISSISNNITIIDAAEDIYISTSQALYNASMSTIAGLDIELTQNSEKVKAYDSIIADNERTIAASNQIIKEEIEQNSYPSTLSSIAAVSAANAKRTAFYKAQANSATTAAVSLDTQLATATAASLEAAKKYSDAQYEINLTRATLQASYYTASMNANTSAQSDITIEIANKFSARSAYAYKEATLLEAAAARKLALKAFSVTTDPQYISTLSSVTRVTNVISSCKMLTSLYSTIIPLVQQVSTTFIDRSAPFLVSENIRNQIIIANAFIDQRQAAIQSIKPPIVSDDLEAAKAAIDAKELEYEVAVEPAISQIEDDLTKLYQVYNAKFDAYTDAKVAYDTAMGQVIPLTNEIIFLNTTVLDLNQQLADAAPGLASFDVTIADIRKKIEAVQDNINTMQVAIDAGIAAELRS